MLCQVLQQGGGWTSVYFDSRDFAFSPAPDIKEILTRLDERYFYIRIRFYNGSSLCEYYLGVDVYFDVAAGGIGYGRYRGSDFKLEFRRPPRGRSSTYIVRASADSWLYGERESLNETLELDGENVTLRVSIRLISDKRFSFSVEAFMIIWDSPPEQWYLVEVKECEEILVDGLGEDWAGLEPAVSDDVGDVSAPYFDLERIFISHYNSDLYLRVDMCSIPPLNLSCDIYPMLLATVYMDVDNNVETGSSQLYSQGSDIYVNFIWEIGRWDRFYAYFYEYEDVCFQRLETYYEGAFSDVYEAMILVPGYTLKGTVRLRFDVSMAVRDVAPSEGWITFGSGGAVETGVPSVAPRSPSPMNITEELSSVERLGLEIELLGSFGLNVSEESYYYDKCKMLVESGELEMAAGLISTLSRSIQARKTYLVCSLLATFLFISILSSLVAILAGRGLPLNILTFYLIVALVSTPSGASAYSSYIILSSALKLFDIQLQPCLRPAVYPVLLGLATFWLPCITNRLSNRPLVRFALKQFGRHRYPWFLTLTSSVILCMSLYLMVHATTSYGILKVSRWETDLSDCIVIGSPQGVDQNLVEEHFEPDYKVFFEEDLISSTAGTLRCGGATVSINGIPVKNVDLLKIEDFNLFPLDLHSLLSSGRLPANPDEAVLIDVQADYLNITREVTVEYEDTAWNYTVVGLIDFEEACETKLIDGSLRRVGSILILTVLSGPSRNSRVVIPVRNASEAERLLSEFIDLYSVGRTKDGYRGYYGYLAAGGRIYEYSKDYIPFWRGIRREYAAFAVPAAICILIYLSSSLTVINLLRHEIRIYAILGLNPRDIRRVFTSQGLLLGLLSSTLGLVASNIVGIIVHGEIPAIEPSWIIVVQATIIAISVAGARIPAGRASLLATPSLRHRWKYESQTVTGHGRTVTRIPLRISRGEIGGFLKFIENYLKTSDPIQPVYTSFARRFSLEVGSYKASGYTFNMSYKPSETGTSLPGTQFKGKIYTVDTERGVEVILSLKPETSGKWSRKATEMAVRKLREQILKWIVEREKYV